MCATARIPGQVGLAGKQYDAYRDVVRAHPDRQGLRTGKGCSGMRAGVPGQGDDLPFCHFVGVMDCWYREIEYASFSSSSPTVDLLIFDFFWPKRYRVYSPLILPSMQMITLECMCLSFEGPTAPESLLYIYICTQMKQRLGHRHNN